MIITISESAFCFAAHIVYQTTQGYLVNGEKIKLDHRASTFQFTRNDVTE